MGVFNEWGFFGGRSVCGDNGIVNGLPFISPAGGAYMAMVAQPASEFNLHGLSPLPAHAIVGGYLETTVDPLTRAQIATLPFLTRGEFITSYSQLWQKVSASSPTAVEFAWNLITNDFAGEGVIFRWAMTRDSQASWKMTR